MHYTFANGVRVHRAHLGQWQLDRYQDTGLHEPHEEAIFLKALDQSPAGTFFDVGAGIGYYSILARVRYPKMRIHAFEPFPKHRQHISDNMRLNGLVDKSIGVHSVGIAETPGVQQFTLDGYGSGIARDRVTERKAATISVRITTLDRLLARNRLVADLVKMDIQGSELAALQGASRSIEKGWIRRWIIGTHSEMLHRHCLQFLRERRYEILFESLVVPGQPDGIVYAIAGVESNGP